MSIFKKQFVVFLCLAGAILLMSCGHSAGDKTDQPAEDPAGETESAPASEPRLYSDQMEYWLPEKEESVEVRFYLTVPNGIQNPILYDQDGTEAGVFEMTGEGSAADADKPADYSAILAIDEVGSYQYYCTYTDEKGEEVQLPSISVQVLESFPDVYYDSEYESSEGIAELCASEKYQNAEYDLRKQMVLEYLEELSKGDYKKGEKYVNPDSVQYSAATDSITFKEAAGSICFVELTDPEPNTNTESVPSSLPDAPLTQEKVDAYIASYDFASEKSQKVQGKIVFFASLDSGTDLSHDMLAAEINDKTGANCVWIQSTLENLRYDLAGNIMNIIELHGKLMERDSVVRPIMQVNEQVRNAANDSALKEDLQNKRVIKAEKGYYVMPEFFEHYYRSEKRLDNSITHIGSCFGLGSGDNKNERLAKAFLNCGSDAVVAHTESVYTDYDMFLVTDILYNLLNGATIRSALDVAESRNHDNDVDFMINYSNETLNHKRARNYIIGDELATLPFSGDFEGMPGPAVSSDDGYYVPEEENRKIVYYSKDKSIKEEMDILLESEGERVLNMQFYDGKLYVRGGKNFYIYDPESDTVKIAEELSEGYFFGATEWMVYGGNIYYIEGTNFGSYSLKTADLDGDRLDRIADIKHSNELPFTYAPVSFMIYEDSVYYVNNTPEGSQIWKAPLDGREQELIYTGKAGDTVNLCDFNSDYIAVLMYNYKLGSDVIALPLKKGADQAIRIVEGVNIASEGCVRIYHGAVLYTVFSDGLYSYDLQSGKSQKVTDQFDRSFSIIDDYIYAMLQEVKYMWYSLK